MNCHLGHRGRRSDFLAEVSVKILSANAMKYVYRLGPGVAARRGGELCTPSYKERRSKGARGAFQSIFKSTYI